MSVATRQKTVRLMDSDQIVRRNNLVTQNYGLARKVAHQYKHKTPLEYDDLEGLAVEGLIKAAERFDVTTGNAFSSFAIPYIRGEILHFIRDQWDLVKVPRRWLEYYQRVVLCQKKTKRAIAQGKRLYQRVPSLEEIDRSFRARRIGCIPTESWDDIVTALARRVISIDELLKEEEGSSQDQALSGHWAHRILKAASGNAESN